MDRFSNLDSWLVEKIDVEREHIILLTYIGMKQICLATLVNEKQAVNTKFTFLRSFVGKASSTHPADPRLFVCT